MIRCAYEDCGFALDESGLLPAVRVAAVVDHAMFEHAGVPAFEFDEDGVLMTVDYR